MDYFGKKLHIKDKQLFWENGEHFFFLADTLWYGLTRRYDLKTFEQILIKRKKQGFTAIQLVVGPPPESSIFNENAKSHNGHLPFNQDFTVTEEYFADITPKIELVIKHQLVPVLYGTWGNYIDTVGEKGMKDLWSHLIESFSKYPVIYCLCGEVDIFPLGQSSKLSLLKKILHKLPVVSKIIKSLYLSNRREELKRRLENWGNILKHISSLNKENHPVTVHINSTQLASEVFPNNSIIDIDSFQSGHSLDGIRHMDSHFSKLKKGIKPYVNLEPLYEGIMGQTDTRLQNYAFWKSVFSQAIGHAYGAHGLWQLANQDNFMDHWGKSNWEEALNYPGAQAIAKAKKLLLSKNVDWSQIEETNDAITITYTEKPTLPILSATYKNMILSYLPFPNLIKTIEVTEQSKYRYEIYDSLTYESPFLTDKLDLPATQLQGHNELFIIGYEV